MKKVITSFDIQGHHAWLLHFMEDVDYTVLLWKSGDHWHYVQAPNRPYCD